MAGYDPSFLGSDVRLPLPAFAPSLVGDVLNSSALREEIHADYINYTIVMNRLRRAPIFAALNINQSLFESVKRRDKWRIDTRIGADFQLDNEYYSANPWDRGHLARRASVAWGENKHEALKASDETFYFSNATLQHENFNQDEWLALEDWVRNLTVDGNDKITEFTGPIYGEFGRTIQPNGRLPAEVPSAFFKVVCFIGKETKQLDVRAFVMFQDKEALADKEGKKFFNFQRYQVTIAEIEKLTGLDFDNRIFETNPLFFSDNKQAREELNVREFPERIEVDEPEEMIAKDEPRVTLPAQEVPVYIAAAMVNSPGDERDNEWISIINLSAEKIDLEGWTLSDQKREPLNLSKALKEADRILLPGEAIRVQPLEPLILSNSGGTITLYSKPSNGVRQGSRIDRVRYTKEQVRHEGIPVVFTTRVAENRLNSALIPEAN